MANYNIGGGFTDSQDNLKEFSGKYSDVDIGPYVGIVKNTHDPLKMGRLGVLLPEKSHVSETNKDARNVIWCQYLSPFYGVKPFESVSKNDPYSHKTSQSSYGMWAVPPDIGTNVLVIFAKGRLNQSAAFWIGCVQEPLTNQMVPGNASSDKSALGVETVGEMDVKKGGNNSKTTNFGTDVLPVGEKNRHMAAGIETLEKWKYPVNVDLANQLMTEGLIEDQVRGTTTSSARRESPSRVFGISTPGRIKSDSRKPNIGLEGSPVAVDRSTGHSFVMDDGDDVGKNQLTRLRTASGHQILMHDTAGVIYIANGSGNAWIEMTRDGRIDLYSGGGINLRTEKDFNLHSDTNVNIHAGGSIRMSANNEIIQSADYMLALGDKGVLTSSQAGAIQTYGSAGVSSYSGGQQTHGAAGEFHIQGSRIDLNLPMGPPGAGTSHWGPTWMTKKEVGMEPSEEPDIELTHKGRKPLETGGRLMPTKTTVHRFVTHEPMPRWEGFPTPELLPGLAADDTKTWSRLSTMPGTAEYMAQQNRLHKDEVIRDAQYQVDAFARAKTLMGISTDPEKAKEILKDFGNTYDKDFDIVNQVGNAWDTANSISNKIQNFDISEVKGKVVDTFRKTLHTQVIDSLKLTTIGQTVGKSVDKFSDSLFVNQAGQLFTLGQSVHGTISKLQNLNATDLKASAKSFAISEGSKFINKNFPISGDIKMVTDVYKNIAGGNITGMISASKLVQKFGGFGASKGFLGKSLHGSGTPLQGAIMSNIGIAQKVVGGWASQGIKAVSSFFSGWSDVRLKEDIQLVGKSPSGINIYRFKYKHTDGTYQGVMAQEVPQARQMTDTGFYMVDYSKLDVEFRRLN